MGAIIKRKKNLDISGTLIAAILILYREVGNVMNVLWIQIFQISSHVPFVQTLEFLLSAWCSLSFVVCLQRFHCSTM